MTTEPNIYTTIGHECGCCGHRHRSVREAGQCLADTGNDNSAPTGALSL